MPKCLPGSLRSLQQPLDHLVEKRDRAVCHQRSNGKSSIYDSCFANFIYHVRLIFAPRVFLFEIHTCICFLNQSFQSKVNVQCWVNKVKYRCVSKNLNMVTCQSANQLKTPAKVS